MSQIPTTKHVAVVGGTGLIGRAFCLETSADIAISSCGRNRENDIHVDLDAPEKGNWSNVDMLVFSAGIRDEDILTLDKSRIETRVQNIKFLIETAISQGVKKLVYLSTAHVYGELVGHIDENSPPNPQSLYADIHLKIEEFALQFTPQHDVLIVRPNAVYGMSFHPQLFQRWTLVPFLFPRLAIFKKQIEVMNPFALRNFVSTDDIVRAVMTWAYKCHKKSPICILNTIGSDNLNMGDFADLCAQIGQEKTGAPVRIIKSSANNHTPLLQYDTIHSGFNPQSSILQFVEEFSSWCIENEERIMSIE